MSDEAFMMVNYVGHRTDWLPVGGGRDILVRLGIDHNAVTIQVLKHLEPTAIQDRLTIKPVEVWLFINHPHGP
jgi:hypothetical protein